MLILEKQPNSIEAESYRILRTNIQHSCLSRNVKSILITSADSKEGKSIVACNLGLSFAQNGQSVIIVDCDLRTPFIDKVFNINNDSGLVEVLTEDQVFIDAVKKYSENLYILTAGSIPENPSEMLDTQEMSSLIDTLKSQFDIVIMDSAPLQDVTDAQILSTKVDGTIIVVKSCESKKDDVLETKNLLDKVGANIIGAVLSGITNDEESKYSNKKKKKIWKVKKSRKGAAVK